MGKIQFWILPFLISIIKLFKGREIKLMERDALYQKFGKIFDVDWIAIDKMGLRL